MNINSPHLKKLLIILITILIGVFLVVLYLARQESDKKSQNMNNTVVPTEEQGPMTQDEIQEVIDKDIEQKVPESERNPLATEEVKEAFGEKVPESERNPLTDEEIEKAFGEKKN